MIGFCDLHYAVKSFFLVITFVAVCSSICLLPHVFSRKKLMPKLLIPLCFFAQWSNADFVCSSGKIGSSVLAYISDY